MLMQLNILESEVADADALLLLENIKVEHFENGNRLVGFNTDEAMAVMKVNRWWNHENLAA